MASENATCANEPNFAIICAFFEKFSTHLDLETPDFQQLQQWLENTDEVPLPLKELHIKLLRKLRKTVHQTAWEAALVKFCYSYSAQDAWEIERFGYKKSSLKVKLHILKHILECQFDRNTKFRTSISTLTADNLRSEPIGRDKLGHSYWLTQDPSCNIRIYQEHLDEEVWRVVADSREELLNLINRLKGNEVISPVEDDIGEDDSSNSSIPAIEVVHPPEEKDDSQDEIITEKIPNIRIKLNTCTVEQVIHNSSKDIFNEGGSNSLGDSAEKIENVAINEISAQSEFKNLVEETEKLKKNDCGVIPNNSFTESIKLPQQHKIENLENPCIISVDQKPDECLKLISDRSEDKILVEETEKLEKNDCGVIQNNSLTKATKLPQEYKIENLENPCIISVDKNPDECLKLISDQSEDKISAEETDKLEKNDCGVIQNDSITEATKLPQEHRIENLENPCIISVDKKPDECLKLISDQSEDKILAEETDKVKNENDCGVIQNDSLTEATKLPQEHKIENLENPCIISVDKKPDECLKLISDQSEDKILAEETDKLEKNDCGVIQNDSLTEATKLPQEHKIENLENPCIISVDKKPDECLKLISDQSEDKILAEETDKVKNENDCGVIQNDSLTEATKLPQEHKIENLENPCIISVDKKPDECLKLISDQSEDKISAEETDKLEKNDCGVIQNDSITEATKLPQEHRIENLENPCIISVDKKPDECLKLISDQSEDKILAEETDKVKNENDCGVIQNDSITEATKLPHEHKIENLENPCIISVDKKPDECLKLISDQSEDKILAEETDKVKNENDCGVIQNDSITEATKLPHEHKIENLENPCIISVDKKPDECLKLISDQSEDKILAEETDKLEKNDCGVIQNDSLTEATKLPHEHKIENLENPCIISVDKKPDECLKLISDQSEDKILAEETDKVKNENDCGVIQNDSITEATKLPHEHRIENLENPCIISVDKKPGECLKLISDQSEDKILVEETEKLETNDCGAIPNNSFTESIKLPQEHKVENLENPCIISVDQKPDECLKLKVDNKNNDACTENNEDKAIILQNEKSKVNEEAVVKSQDMSISKIEQISKKEEKVNEGIIQSNKESSIKDKKNDSNSKNVAVEKNEIPDIKMKVRSADDFPALVEENPSTTCEANNSTSLYHEQNGSPPLDLVLNEEKLQNVDLEAVTVKKSNARVNCTESKDNEIKNEILVPGIKRNIVSSDKTKSQNAEMPPKKRLLSHINSKTDDCTKYVVESIKESVNVVNTISEEYVLKFKEEAIENVDSVDKKSLTTIKEELIMECDNSERKESDIKCDVNAALDKVKLETLNEPSSESKLMIETNVFEHVSNEIENENNIQKVESIKEKEPSVECEETVNTIAAIKCNKDLSDYNNETELKKETMFDCDILGKNVSFELHNDKIDSKEMTEDEELAESNIVQKNVNKTEKTDVTVPENGEVKNIRKSTIEFEKLECKEECHEVVENLQEIKSEVTEIAEKIELEYNFNEIQSKENPASNELENKNNIIKSESDESPIPIDGLKKNLESEGISRKRPFFEVNGENLDKETVKKSRPSLLGDNHFKKISKYEKYGRELDEESEEDEDNEHFMDNEIDESGVSEEINESVLIVKGEGSGEECKSSFINLFGLLLSDQTEIVDEAIEENIIMFYGEGSGKDCLVGNTQNEIEKFNACIGSEVLKTKNNDVSFKKTENQVHDHKKIVKKDNSNSATLENGGKTNEEILGTVDLTTKSDMKEMKLTQSNAKQNEESEEKIEAFETGRTKKNEYTAERNINRKQKLSKNRQKDEFKKNKKGTNLKKEAQIVCISDDEAKTTIKDNSIKNDIIAVSDDNEKINVSSDSDQQQTLLQMTTGSKNRKDSPILLEPELKTFDNVLFKEKNNIKKTKLKKGKNVKKKMKKIEKTINLTIESPTETSSTSKIEPLNVINTSQELADDNGNLDEFKSLTKQKTRRKLELDKSNIIDDGTDTTPVRQSRRIAQIKIREEAERRKLEEITLKKMKDDFKKKKKEEYKIVPIILEMSEASEKESDPDSGEANVKKKLHKKRKGGKKGKWSSGSEDEADEEEELEYYSEVGSPLLRSDHEFSPESELEDESLAMPLKRARTARKEGETEDVNEMDALDGCEKCGKKDHPEWILLCDKCDKGYHCSCLSPVLFLIPEGDWFCPPCQQEKLIESLEQYVNIFDTLVQNKILEEQIRERNLALAMSEAIKSERELKETEKEGRKNRRRNRGLDSNSDYSDKSNRVNRSRRRSISSCSRSSCSSNTSTSRSSSSTDSDEPIYKLRKRRQINVSYRLNQYDDLIDSAIKDEMSEVAGAGNLGRGKDISTIIEADKEEKLRLKLEGQKENDEIVNNLVEHEVEEFDETNIKEDTNGGKVDNDNEEKIKAEDSGSDFEPIKRKSKVKNRSTKKKKLNCLEVSSEDDGSDEDFKTSSYGTEDEESISEVSESDTSLEVYKRKSKQHKRSKRSARRAKRSRHNRYDNFIADDSEDSDVCPKKKRKPKLDSDYSETGTEDDEISEDIDSEDLCDDSTESDESDGAWRPANKRKPKKNFQKLKKTPTVYNKEKKKIRQLDSDEDIKTTKKKIKKNYDFDENSMDSTRKTRGKRFTYLEDYDDESSDNGIKPGVKRPDTPPEEREEFIRKQEEIKRMLAEKNSEAEIVATPALQKVPELLLETNPKIQEKPQTPVKDVKQTPPELVENQNLVECDDPDTDFDDDLPEDFNPEDMDEEVIAKMMEEEDFAQQQLKLAGEAIRQKKIREMDISNRPDVELLRVPKPSQPIGLQQMLKRAAPVPICPPSQSNIHLSRLSNMPTLPSYQQNRTVIQSPIGHILNPIQSQLINQQKSMTVKQSSMSNIVSGKQSQVEASINVPPRIISSQGQLIRPQQSPLKLNEPLKPRGRRKKITPLRDTLQKQQTAAAAAAAAVVAASVNQSTNIAIIKTKELPILDKTNSASTLSIAPPPQLYKSPTNPSPSVITRMPQRIPFPEHNQRFYAPPNQGPHRMPLRHPGHPMVPHHRQRPPYSGRPQSLRPANLNSPNTVPNILVRHSVPPRLQPSFGPGDQFTGRPTHAAQALPPYRPPLYGTPGFPPAPPAHSASDYSVSQYPPAQYGGFYPRPPNTIKSHTAPQPSVPQQQPSKSSTSAISSNVMSPNPSPPAPQAPVAEPVASTILTGPKAIPLETFNSKSNLTLVDNATTHNQSVKPNENDDTEQIERPSNTTSEFSGLVSYFSSQHDDLNT